MGEDEGELRETPSLGARLVEYLLLGVFEQADRLLALVHKVLHEDAEELVLVQKGHVLLVVLEHDAEVLVGVGQNVQDKRGTVLQVESPIGAVSHDLVHHFPRLLYRLLVYGGLGLLLCVDSLRDGLQPVP